MLRFLAGMAFGALGVAMCIAATTASFALMHEGEENVFGHPLTATLMVLGFVSTIGGPVFFWWALPIWLNARRR